MEFILDIRFEDINYNAIVHFITTLEVDSEDKAELFKNELIEGFKRKGVYVLFGTFHRLDNNPDLRNSQYEYYRFYMSRATATVKIEQFVLENPNQSESLIENLTSKFFNGEKSTAVIGNEYNIPVRVMDKATRNPIDGDFYYSTIEHLIPGK